MMRILEHHRKRANKLLMQQQLSVSIRFNQNVFKRTLTQVFTNEFVMSIPVVKDAHVTQSKHFP